MTVQELIEELMKIEDREMIVATRQYDSGLNVVVDKEQVQFQVETINSRHSNYVCI